MTADPRRRWFRFGLRTMLIAVAVAAIPLGWTGYQLNWIRERRIAAEKEGASFAGEKMRAPFPLWLFGENGRAVILLFPGSELDAEEYRRLFPETEYIQAMAMPVDVTPPH